MQNIGNHAPESKAMIDKASEWVTEFFKKHDSANTRSLQAEAEKSNIHSWAVRVAVSTLPIRKERDKHRGILLWPRSAWLREIRNQH